MYNLSMSMKPEEILRAKVKILYILNNFNIPLTRAQFYDFIQHEEIMSLFEVQAFVDELQKSKMIEISESENREYILITELGRDAVEMMSGEIAQPLLRKINDSIDERKRFINIKTNIQAEYVKLDDLEYNVQLSITEGAERLMYINLSVLTNKDAKVICDNWKNNARFMYGDLLNVLTNYDKNPDHDQNDNEDKS